MIFRRKRNAAPASNAILQVSPSDPGTLPSREVQVPIGHRRGGAAPGGLLHDAEGEAAAVASTDANTEADGGSP